MRGAAIGAWSAVTVRRQLLNFSSRSVDVRMGSRALDELSRMVRGTVGLPKRAALVAAGSLGAELETEIRHELVDAGFTVTRIVLPDGDELQSMGAVTSVLEDLGHMGATRDDVLVCAGDAVACSVGSLAAKLWCGGMSCALIPTTFDAMITVATSMEPLSAGGVSGVAWMTPEPSLVVCDIDFVTESSLSERACGYVYLMGSLLADSRRSWDRMGELVPRLVEGDPRAYVDALAAAQLARRAVVTAANPSARNALQYGLTCARALRACLGGGVPWHVLHAEGMRFEARLAVEAAKFDVDAVFEQDDRFDDLGIEELPFKLDVDRFIDALKEANARYSNRLLFALPKNPGIIRLTAVTDDVLVRHASAYVASRAELLEEDEAVE